MNKILATAFCLGLALAPLAHADNNDKDKHAKQHANRAAVVAQHNTIHAVRHPATVQSRAAISHNNAVNRNYSNRPAVYNNGSSARVNSHAYVNQAQRNRTLNNHSIVRNNSFAHRNNNVVIRNRNSYAQARNRVNWHQRHDRDWWRHHYSRFVLFGGGYYFYDGGYWYPAYGYDPAYTTYAYDEPIYGYNQMAPGQVITNVQEELQRDGYYQGDIDGLLGPATRDALARYQADNGLVVTQAIDEPTLESLGLA